MITKKVLSQLGVKDQRAEKYLPALKRVLPEYHIDTPLRVCHFLAQVLHESALMKTVRENLNYSAAALLKVFPKYFKTEAEAETYARKPRLIANKVYAGRMGNGDEASGDGFRYRGRGLIQLTGKNNYQKFSDWIHDDLVSQPDRVASEYPVHSAVYFWTTRHLNAHADVDDIRKITKIINGGYHGLAQREELLLQAKDLLGVGPFLHPPIESLSDATHRVIASSLRLRREPETTANNVITSLPKGYLVKKLRTSTVPDWAKVQVIVQGQLTKGFVAGKYLQELRRE